MLQRIRSITVSIIVLAVVAMAVLIYILAFGVKAEENVAVFNETVEKKWKVSAYVGKTSKQFSHCSISTQYGASNNKMRAEWMDIGVSANYKGGMMLYLSAEDWNLTPDRTYEFKATFDNDFWIEGTVIATDKSTMWLNIGNEYQKDFKSYFSSSVLIEFKVNDHSLGEFPLDGAGLSIKALEKCVKDHSGAPPQTSSSDTFR